MRAGSGANMALVDAWELAQQLVSNRHNSTQAAIAEFTARGAARSTAAINGSHRVITMAHSQGLTKLLFVGFFKIMGSLLGMSQASKTWLKWSKYWPSWLSLSSRASQKRA